MKCVVLAYHNIGRAGIEALLRNGFEISAVFTHRDNPDENIWFGSVAELAGEHGIPVFAPESINHPVWVERIRAMAPDFIFSFYYRELVKPEILAIPAKGCVNLHGSLLPKYRGRVPLNWAIINGEKETGVTLHYMTSRADAGDIIGQERFEITEDDTARTVFGKAEAAAGKLLDEMLPKLADGTAPRIAQNEAEATCFGGRRPADGEIDWRRSATEVRNLVRAVTRPYPGAFSFIGDRKCFFWAVDVVEPSRKAAPGTVLSSVPFTIACGEGAVRVRSGQLDGGVFLAGDQLASDARIVSNMVFGSDPRKIREAATSANGCSIPANTTFTGWTSGTTTSTICSTAPVSISARGTSRFTASGSSTTSASATSCCRWSRSPHRSNTPAIRCGCLSWISRRTSGLSATA